MGNKTNQDDEKKEKAPSLIGRDAELNRLKSFLDDLGNDGAKTLFIIGEAGMGKSKLIQEAKERFSLDNFVIMEAFCDQRGNQPFLPLQKAWEKAKASSLPSLEHLNGKEDIEVTDKEMLDAHRNAAFYETAEKLRDDAEESPHLLILEDIHWADEGTLNLFHYLTDRLKGEPILFIATYQQGEVHPESLLKEMLELMSRKDLYEELELDPLSVEDVEAMVKSLLGIDDVPGEFLENLCEKTDCNPILIKETIDHMVEAGELSPEEDRFPEFDDDIIIPELIKEVVDRRVSHLDLSSRETLQLGSVIGKEVPFSLLSESSDMSDLDLLDHIDRLTDHGFWIRSSEEDEVFQFSHEMILRAVYEGVGDWVEKPNLHGMVAETMEDEYDEELEGKYSIIARHYEIGERYKKALDFYENAANKAKKMYSHEDAVKMYEKALDVLDNLLGREEKKVEILKDMGMSYRLMGEYDKSRDVFFKALNYVSDFEKNQILYLEIIATLQDHGKFDEALSFTEKRLSLHDEDDLIKAKLLSNKGECLSKMGRFDEAFKTFKEEVSIAEELQKDDVLAQAYHDLGTNATKRRKFKDAEKYLKRAKNLWEKMDDKNKLSRTLNNIAGIYFYLGDVGKALEEFKSCLNIYDQMGDKARIVMMENNIGLTYQKKGMFDEALQHFERGLELSTRIENEFQKCHILINMGLTYLEKEKCDEAMKYLRDGHAIANRVGHLDKEIQSKFLLGKIEVKRQKNKKAEDYLRQLIESSSQREVERDQGLIKLLEGMIERGKCNKERSINLFEEAIQIFEETNSDEIKAKALYELGSVMKDEGNEEKAKEYFEKAKNIFEEKGMNHWSNKIEKEHR